MKKVRLILAVIVSLVGAANLTRAEEGASSTPQAEAKAEAKKARQMPFRGKVSAVDVTGQTVTLAGREKSRRYSVCATSKILRDGKTIALDAVQPGESVGGLARETEAGQWEILTLNVGLKDAKSKSDDKPAGSAM